MGDSNIKSGVYAPNGVPVAVFGWLADTGACGQYRMMQPLKALARKYEAQVEYGGASELPFTILVAQRTHGVEQVDFLKHVLSVREAANGVDVPKIVYELDDDLWSIEQDNPGYEYYNAPGVLDRAAEAAGFSDLVTVSTEPLAEVMRKYNDNVVVLPNTIPQRYLNEARYPYRAGTPDKPFVIGWAGSATHLNDFKMCASSLNTFLKFNQHSRMVFFGTDYSHLLDPSVRPQCRTAPWTATVKEYLDLLSAAQIDVMLAPLAPTRFALSKSNLRLIEANALGIPVIATDFGPYAADHSPGVEYVSAGDSWIPALSKLQSPMVRLEMSSAGRQWISDHYTQEGNIHLWMEAYTNVLSS